jgi:hypothetical protein
MNINDLYYVQMSGPTEDFSNAYFEAAFYSASIAMENSTGCTPSIISTIVEARILLGRRRLQTTPGEEIVYALKTLQVHQGDIFRPEYANPFLVEFNSILAENGISATGIHSSLSPTQPPTKSTTTLAPTTFTPTTVSPTKSPNKAPIKNPNEPNASPSTVPAFPPNTRKPNVSPSKVPTFSPTTRKPTTKAPTLSMLPTAKPTMDPTKLRSPSPTTKLPSPSPTSSTTNTTKFTSTQELREAVVAAQSAGADCDAEVKTSSA